jgi:small-conductance mechanosensitive channel
VVIGEKNSTYYCAKKTIDKFEDYILVLGKKPSNKLDYYISRAKFSFVFYSGEYMNNYLCAPNRLYNSLKFGVPVIAGENPTMKNIIKQHKCGIVINSFGESSLEIGESIKTMNTSYSMIKKKYRFNIRKI